MGWSSEKESVIQDENKVMKVKSESEEKSWFGNLSAYCTSSDDSKVTMHCCRTKKSKDVCVEPATSAKVMQKELSCLSCSFGRDDHYTSLNRPCSPANSCALVRPWLVALLVALASASPVALSPALPTPTSNRPLIAKCCALGEALAHDPVAAEFVCVSFKEPSLSAGEIRAIGVTAPSSEASLAESTNPVTSFDESMLPGETTTNGSPGPATDDLVVPTTLEALGEPAALVESTTSVEVESPSQESVETVLARGFPAWVDPRTTVVNAAGEKITAREFLETNPKAHLKYGLHPHCADSQLLLTRRREHFSLSANGSLLLSLSSMGGSGATLLPPGDFCADRVLPPGGSPRVALIACPCRRVLCVRKCCAGTRRLHVSVGRSVGIECVAPPPQEKNRSWRPVFHGDDLTPLGEAPSHHLLQQAMPTCDRGDAQVLLNYENEGEARRLWVLSNGSALMEGYGRGESVEGARWCADMSAAADGGRAHEHNALFCAPTFASAPSDRPMATASAAYGSLFLVGAFFLLLTLAVYAALPELRAPPHAKALCCHCVALLIASVLLATGQFMASMPALYCVVSALLIQFFTLSSFFWLNVLCIDISWAFSGLRGLLGSLLDTSRRKFVYYSLYAWGGPLVISIVTATLQEMGEENKLPKGVVAPKIGERYCWFHGVAATWAFLYGPMAALLLANAALFAFTAARLARAHRDAAELNRGDSIRHDCSTRLSAEKYRLILYAKLFILMGATWLLEVVSWAVWPSADGDGAHPAWYVTDAINMLRGVFIFVIFCCKRNVARLLVKRFEGWGLPCGARVGDVVRTPTHRSGVSTRQSSLLPLGPLPKLDEAVGVVANGMQTVDSNTGEEAPRKASIVSIKVPD